jgi:hypothetical protein
MYAVEQLNMLRGYLIIHPHNITGAMVASKLTSSKSFPCVWAMEEFSTKWVTEELTATNYKPLGVSSPSIEAERCSRPVYCVS